MPGGYSLPEYLEPITLKPVFRPEPLLQAARKVIGEVALVVPGDNVLILSDSSINPLLLQVFEQAALEKKAEVRTHSIPLSPTSDTVTLLQEQHWRDWWPQETWDEVRTADVVLALAYINPEFLKEPLLSGQIESGQLRFISVTAVPELLAAPGAFYPPEIIDLLAEKIALQLGQAKTIRVTDPAGTALTFTPGNVTHSPPAPSLAFPYNAWVQVTPGEDMRGSVVSHSISTGFMPLLRMGIEAGRMVSLQGGGEIGELLKLQDRESFQLHTVGWALHPRSVRLPKPLTGSAALHNQLSSAGRAGAMRMGFWGEDPSQSFFLQVYFPSVWADGEEVFREGYPMALRDPEVLQLAEALGGTELLVVQCTVLPGTFPESRAPTIEPITTVDPLLPALELLIQDVAGISGDEKVLIITDDSVPLLSLEGLEAALAETDAQVRTISTQVPEPDTEALSLLQQAVARNFSAELKQAIEEADCVLSLSYFHLPQLTIDGQDMDSWLESIRTRWVGVVAIPELLTSKWATYPPQLLELIGRKVEEELQAESTIILSNNIGTSLIFDYDVVRSPFARNWSVFPGNIRFRMVPKDRGVEGIIVTSNIFSGRVPRTEIHIGQSQVVELDASARLANAVRTATAQGGFLEVSFGVNPKAFPLPAAVSGFSSLLWSYYAATQRSGVVSVSLGPWAENEGRLPLAMYFGLLNAGGPRILIDLGHLTALDDAEVQELAEQLGSVEELLQEDWIPSLGER